MNNYLKSGPSPGPTIISVFQYKMRKAKQRFFSITNCWETNVSPSNKFPKLIFLTFSVKWIYCTIFEKILFFTSAILGSPCQPPRWFAQILNLRILLSSFNLFGIRGASSKTIKTGLNCQPFCWHLWSWQKIIRVCGMDLSFYSTHIVHIHKVRALVIHAYIFLRQMHAQNNFVSQISILYNSYTTLCWHTPKNIY